MNTSSFCSRCTGLKAILLITLAIILMQASGFSDIIPSDRRIAWSRDIVGVPGGIPNRTTIFADVTKPPYNADNTGKSDASVAIQSAVLACPANQVVYMPPGTYRIDSSMNFKFAKNVTLRGAGDSTVLVDNSTSGLGMIYVGGDTAMSAGTAITGGLAKGLSRLTVSDASGFRVGMLVAIDQDNDPNLVWHPSGYNRLLGQTTRISAISGKTITVSPASYWNWSSALNPKLYNWGGNQAEGVGLEDFKVDRTKSAVMSTIFFDRSFGCWIKGVRSEMATAYHFYAWGSACLEIRQSTAWDSQSHGPNGGGVVFYQRVSSSLIEDNIFYRVFPGVEINSYCGGNVIAYNDMEDNYTDSRLMGGSFDCNHGAHPCMDLYEGNTGSMFQSDGYFGSASHITLFRNWFYGTNPTLTLNSKCVDLCHWSQYFNVIGNVLGTAGVSQVYDPADTLSYTTPTIYRLGFPNMGNDSYTGTRPPSTDPQALDTRVRDTLIRHGNYDFVTKSTVWDPNIQDHGLPASLYLASKPAWFGSLAWPPIGPDTTPMAGTIPARARFQGINYQGVNHTNSLSAPTGLRVAPSN
jgi:hypothetical protein